MAAGQPRTACNWQEYDRCEFRRLPICPALRTVSVLPTCRANNLLGEAQRLAEIETQDVCLVPGRFVN